MKNILLSLAVAFALFSCGNKEEEKVTTEKMEGSTLKSTFHVWGNCETCKDAIENSLHVDGVTEANWNVDTKMISVTYDSTKISLDQVEKNIAAAGYDNVKYKGDDKAYENLPQCCKYDRK